MELKRADKDCGARLRELLNTFMITTTMILIGSSRLMMTPSLLWRISNYSLQTTALMISFILVTTTNTLG